MWMTAQLFEPALALLAIIYALSVLSGSGGPDEPG